MERTLKSFAVNLNGNPTFADILNQARGEKIEVVLQQTNASLGRYTAAANPRQMSLSIRVHF